MHSGEMFHFDFELFRSYHSVARMLMKNVIQMEKLDHPFEEVQISNFELFIFFFKLMGERGVE